MSFAFSLGDVRIGFTLPCRDFAFEFLVTCEGRIDKIKEAVRYLADAGKVFSERQNGARWGSQLESCSRPVLIIEKRQVSRIEP